MQKLYRELSDFKNKYAEHPSNWAESAIRFSFIVSFLFLSVLRGGVDKWIAIVYQIIVLVAIDLLLFDRIIRGKRIRVKTPVNNPLIGWIVLALISCAYSTDRADSMEAFSHFLVYPAALFILSHTFRTRSQKLLLLYTVIAASLMMAIPVFLQSLFFSNDNESREVLRSLIYVNPNNLAGFIEMTIPIVIGLSIYYFTEKIRLLFLGLVLGGLFFLHMSTISRGGWIGVCFGLSFMAISFISFKELPKQKIWIVLAGLLFFVFLFFVYTPALEKISLMVRSEDPTVRNRIEIWKSTITMIKDYPLFGVGPGQYANIFTQYHPPTHEDRVFYAHNEYLQIIAELGVLAIPLYIWSMIKLFFAGFSKRNEESRFEQIVALGAMSGIVALLLHNIVEFNLSIPSNAVLATILVHLVISRTSDKPLKKRL